MLLCVVFFTRLWWHASANCAMLLTHAVRCRLDRLGLECIANHTDCLGQFLGPPPAPEQFQLKGIGHTRYQFIKYWVLRVRKSTTLRVLKQTAILLPNQGDNHDTDYIHSTSRSLGERDVLVASRAFGGLHHIIRFFHRSRCFGVTATCFVSAYFSKMCTEGRL